MERHQFYAVLGAQALPQALSIVANAVIVLSTVRFRRLRRNGSLRLVLALASADLLFALLLVPFTLLMLFQATYSSVGIADGDEKSDEFNEFRAKQLLWFAQPLVVYHKIRLCLFTAIAFDRIQAICWPFYYRSKRKSQRRSKLTLGTALAAISFTVMDFAVEFLCIRRKDADERQPNAEASNFSSLKFLHNSVFQQYQAIGILPFSCVVLVLISCVVFADARRMAKRSARKQSSGSGGVSQRSIPSGGVQGLVKKLHLSQLGRIFCCLFVAEFLLQLLPAFGQILWKTATNGSPPMWSLQTTVFGPLNMNGLLLLGALNAFVHLTLHGELRRWSRQSFRVRPKTLPQTKRIPLNRYNPNIVIDPSSLNHLQFFNNSSARSSASSTGFSDVTERENSTTPTTMATACKHLLRVTVAPQMAGGQRNEKTTTLKVTQKKFSPKNVFLGRIKMKTFEL